MKPKRQGDVSGKVNKVVEENIYKIAKDKGLLIFVVKPQHVREANEWLKQHKPLCKLSKARVRAAIGEGPTFTFTSTSIGEMQYVECSCGEKAMINIDEL